MRLMNGREVPQSDDKLSFQASPTPARGLFRVFYRSGLPYHRNLYLPRILELVLDLVRDLSRKHQRAVILYFLLIDQNAHLSTSLNRVGLVDAFE